MILLLKNFLIPWTVSFLMLCITGLGVNFGDIDLNQQSKDALIAVNGVDTALSQNINVDRPYRDNFTYSQKGYRDGELLFLPKPSGGYPVGTTSYYLTDSKREEIYTEEPDDHRELMVRVWYPSKQVLKVKHAPYFNQSLAVEDSLGAIATNSIVNAPVARTQSNYPVLLFSHGFASLPEFNTINAEELASQGYVVVTINHTYESSFSVFPDGRVITTSQFFNSVIKEQLESLNKNLNKNSKENLYNSETLEIFKQSVEVRAKDAQFVLDKLEEINGKNPSGLLTGKLDLDRVGMFGHSLGGATAAQTLLQDKRFKAGIDLDGGLFINGINKSLSQPFMFMNSELLGTGNTSNSDFQEAIELQKTFFQHLQSDTYKVIINGTGHFYFNDLPFILPELKNAKLPLPFTQFENWVAADNSNPINPDRAIKIINDYTVAFFNKYLNHEKSSLLKIKPSSLTYPEVIFEFRKGEDVTSTHYPSSVTFR